MRDLKFVLTGYSRFIGPGPLRWTQHSQYRRPGPLQWSNILSPSCGMPHTLLENVSSCALKVTDLPHTKSDVGIYGTSPPGRTVVP